MLSRRLLHFHVLLSAAMLSVAGHLAAQSALSIPPQNCVWQQGDNPAWAAPNLDDSGWQPASKWSGLSTPTPYFWLRCRFHPSRLAPTVQPQLQVSGDLAWQIFANGRLIGSSGDVLTGAHAVGLAVDYPAAEFLQRNDPVSVAVRMTFTPEINGGQLLPQLALGDPNFQQNAYYYAVYQSTQAQCITWICYALIASAGFFFLALYWFDRTQRYVLWISLTWLSLADLRINEFLVASSVHYPSFFEFFLYAIGQVVPVVYVLFYFALNQKPVPRFFKFVIAVNLYDWLALTLAALLPLRASMTLRWSTEINDWMNTIQIVATLAAISCVPVAFWPLRALRRWQIPLAVVALVWAAIDSLYVIVQLPFLHFDVGNMFLKIQPYRSIAIAVVVVSLTLLLVQRIRSSNRERAALAGEMQAARQIQRLLVPETLATASGWTVDAAFLPAREVGGDFYRCHVLPNGDERLLLGDVSGKGAAAAMTAAMLVGASEGRDKDSPAQLLEHLNRVLKSSGIEGFATCLCAHLAPDGRVTLADAGHLPPYVNGREVAVQFALPLGVAAASSYAESGFSVAPGDQLTFLSDGVVEARNTSGELFGFERTAAISTESAQNIARAASTHGQEDDITVLTLTLVGAPAHA
jgi:phosphoserine phosphatase RsbU/P